jgi:hypothetical protein
MFRSTNRKLIRADLQPLCNLIKKAIPESFTGGMKVYVIPMNLSIIQMLTAKYGS